MKKLTTQIITLIFLFLFPSVSFSQTFKCEFITEKFKGGKSNTGSCSGDPELRFQSTDRSSHCESDPLDLDNYVDFLNYIVDIDNKVISYVEKGKGGFPQERGNPFKHNRSREILSVIPHSERIFLLGDGGKKFKSITTKSYLVISKLLYENDLMNDPLDENLSTLYIPENGKSIITGFGSFGVGGGGEETSYGRMKFGKCVNTSN
jgi:hypothetical protein